MSDFEYLLEKEAEKTDVAEHTKRLREQGEASALEFETVRDAIRDLKKVRDILNHASVSAHIAKKQNLFSADALSEELNNMIASIDEEIADKTNLLTFYGVMA